MNHSLGLAFRWGAGPRGWGILLFVLFSTDLFAAPPVTSIAPPCAEAQRDAQGNEAWYLPSCRSASADTEDLSACVPGADGSMPDAFKRMSIPGRARCALRRELLVQSELFYRGVIYDPSPVPSPAPPGPVSLGKPSQVPVCSPWPNFFNGRQAEENQNHLASPPTTLQRQLASISIPWPSTPPEANSCGDFIRVESVHPRFRIVNSGTAGRRENAYLRGLVLQSLDCARTSVETQLFAPSPRVTVSEACQGIAADLDIRGRNLLNESNALADRLKDQPRNILQTMINDPCDQSSTEDNDPSNPDAPKLRTIRQSAMYLCSNRVEYESFFKQLLYCEVNARGLRMSHHYPGLDQVISEINTRISTDARCRVCRQRAEAANEEYILAWALRATFPDPITFGVTQVWLDRIAADTASGGEITNCTNVCYREVSQDYFRQLGERWNPDSGECRRTPSAWNATRRRDDFPASPYLPAGISWVTGLALALSLQRRPTRRKVVSNVFSLLFIVALGGSGVGCTPSEPTVNCYLPIESPDARGAEPCPAEAPQRVGYVCLLPADGATQCNCPGYESKDCCDAQGVPISASDLAAQRAEGKCLGRGGPFVGPITGTFRRTGELLRTSHLNNASAVGLRTDDERNTIDPSAGPDALARGAQATADDNNEFGKPKKDNSGASGAHLGGLPNAQGSGGSKSGASGAVGGAGGVAQAPPAPMHDLLNAGNDPSQSAATAGTGNVGVYSGGGGGAAGAGRGGFGSGFDSGGGAIAGGGGAGSIDFSGSTGAEGERVEALGSSDPEDYFTRIALDNSLFKIVRARYQSTSLRWKNEDSAKASDRALAPRPR